MLAIHNVDDLYGLGLPVCCALSLLCLVQSPIATNKVTLVYGNITKYKGNLFFRTLIVWE